jgi:hypothetical protein
MFACNSHNTYYDLHSVLCFLTINVFFFVEYLPEDVRKRPKHVGGLPHLYHFIQLVCKFCVYVVTYLTARNIGNFKFMKEALRKYEHWIEKHISIVVML